jgi:hypothetical protein
LFKAALRAITPAGADWTKYVAQARWALMYAISKTRGGRTPIELATGVAPTLSR